MNTQVLLVEHDDVGGLYPFSTSHCCWELRIGPLTILERWQQSVPTATVTGTSHRDLHFRSFFERYPTTAPYQQQRSLIVAGNLVVSPSVMRQMVEMCELSVQPIVFFCNGQPVAVFVTDPPETPAAAASALEVMDSASARNVEIDGRVITRLWQVFDCLHQGIRWDAELVQKRIDDEAIVHPSVVIDESQGPVIIYDHVMVEPFCYLRGPISIGPHTIVKSHSRIETSVIGPVCKVSGEIYASVFQGFGNKQHDGFAGHSYIGEWCNLAAGTTTSNLKSTLGTVRVKLPWLTEDTQQQFVGTLFGDFARTEIGTQLPVGGVVGVCSNVSNSSNPPSLVPPFTWTTQSPSQVYDLEALLSIMKKTMSRRDVKLGPASEALFRHLHKQSHG